jgi:hypothetical protein
MPDGTLGAEAPFRRGILRCGIRVRSGLWPPNACAGATACTDSALSVFHPLQGELRRTMIESDCALRTNGEN